MDTYFCGNFNQQKLFNKPTLIQFQDPNFQLENVHDLGEIILQSRSQHALFLSMEGFVYSLGDYKNGKLGHVKQSLQNLNLNQPNIIEKLKKFRIQQISCGFNHNLALGYIRDGNQNSQQLYKNTIFSWGKGSDGCLGQGNSNDYYEPEIIVNFQKSDQLIKVICCSENSSFVLLQNGDIYSFGGNEYGELGHDNYFPCFQPSKVQINEAINNISPGKNHIFALSEKGNFYSWGSGQFGQLGNKNFQIKQKMPLILSGFASKYHIEMCINSIKMILYEDQTFIIMPSLETVKFERIQLKKQKQLSQSDSQKIQQEDQIQIQNKNRAQSDFIKKPKQQDEFSHLKQPVFKNIDEFLEKVKKHKKKTEYNIQLEQDDSQKSEQTLNRDKQNQFNKNYQNFSKLNIKDLKKTLDQEKIVIQKTIEKIFYSKTEQQEKNKRLLTQDWEENILPYWETKKQSEEISLLVYQGIPPELRSEVWYRGVPNRLSITRDFFKVCLEKSKRFMNYLQQKKLKQLSPEIIQAIEEIIIEQDLDKGHTQKLNKEDSLRMIENDLSRTFTHLGIFNENSPLLQNLREVLMAFVMARPDIGYLQGMSYICAILVLYMDKFRAFVIFTNMITAPSLMPFYQLEKEHYFKNQKNSSDSLYKKQKEQAFTILKEAEKIKKKIQKDLNNIDLKDSNSKENQWLTDEIQLCDFNLTFENIVLDEKVTISLKEQIIMPYRFPHIFDQTNFKINKAFLFYGPSGTGKTKAIQIMASEAKCKVIKINYNFLYNNMDPYNTPAQKLKHVFKIASQNQPCIIHIDEIDQIFSYKQNESEYMKEKIIQAKTQFLVQYQGILEQKVTIISESNQPWNIDLVVRKRYSQADIQDIIKQALFMPVQELQNAEKFKLITNPAGYKQWSCCNNDDSQGIQKTLKDFDSNEQNNLYIRDSNRDDILKSIEKIKKSIDQTQVQQFEEYYKIFDSID
ncbi:Regulator of chromosome condensation 1/beta-lactamase-inhibitor protein II [Pseudocohnilembus persalinus]|uniref:Regulator of chromosome condensation 1/beta-lactamase-inhibitor protein II n=1 Tax=Pseudocohnilembus persalinus TaxID=266149 RepID=A0A0V0QEB4_PSEPJ|nr:Regulator of chromosome condensation 1/beta-lactamase-inhibitor protein II [Pseudocohnilembus persalinus]|eukprot:KRX00448.1 Regulator of chromosome condensation 1/beta-lactamase-inhibitor protein II [Pseudocohnilembus persalinus]